MPRREREQAPGPSTADVIASAIHVQGWLPLGDVPEGGRKAWLVVLGLTCCLFTTYGYINSWGVFQTYYEQNLHIGLTPTKLSWIGAAQRSLFFLSVIPSSRLFDRGYHEQLFIPASILLVASLVLTAECKEFWQLLLCQGVLSGITAGCLVSNVSTICAQYFRKKYGMALTIAYGGSALGGVAFSVVAGLALPRLGFQWTMRILGLVAFIALLIANATIRRRLPSATHDRKLPLLSLKPLKSIAFSLYCLALLFQVIGFYTFTTYVSSTAVTQGIITPEIGYFLIGVLNASTGIGRVVANKLSPKSGSFNLIIPTLAASSIILFTAWPAVDTEEALLGLTVVYALLAAPHNALASKSISAFSTSVDEGLLRIGLFNAFAAIAGLAGPPTAGFVGDKGGMWAMGWFAGGCGLFAALLLFGSRYLVLGKKVRGRI